MAGFLDGAKRLLLISEQLKRLEGNIASLSKAVKDHEARIIRLEEGEKRVIVEAKAAAQTAATAGANLMVSDLRDKVATIQAELKLLNNGTRGGHPRLAHGGKTKRDDHDSE